MKVHSLAWVRTHPSYHFNKHFFEPAELRDRFHFIRSLVLKYEFARCRIFNIFMNPPLKVQVVFFIPAKVWVLRVKSQIASRDLSLSDVSVFSSTAWTTIERWSWLLQCGRPADCDNTDGFAVASFNVANSNSGSRCSHVVSFWFTENPPERRCYKSCTAITN